MKSEWKEVEIEKLPKNKFRLSKSPTHAQLCGLELHFTPSHYWKQKNPTIEPVMRTDLIAGSEEYKLPRYFRFSSIEKVLALLPI